MPLLTAVSTDREPGGALLVMGDETAIPEAGSERHPRPDPNLPGLRRHPARALIAKLHETACGAPIEMHARRITIHVAPADWVLATSVRASRSGDWQATHPIEATPWLP